MKRLKKVLLALILIICATSAGAAIYINDYYRATDEAWKSITQPSNGVEVETTEEGTYVFTKEGADKGIIFYPGGKVQAESYGPLMEALAKRGFVTVLVEMPGNLAVLDIEAAEGIQERFENVDQWYIAGHSLGGTMAGEYVAEHQEDFEGIILLGSYVVEDLSDSDLKAISIYGSNDKVLNMEKYMENKKNLPGNYYEIVIKGGCHSGFGNYGHQEGDGNVEISSFEQIERTAWEIEKWVQPKKR